jgi:hypothetical protein
MDYTQNTQGDFDQLSGVTQSQASAGPGFDFDDEARPTLAHPSHYSIIAAWVAFPGPR